MARTLSVPDIDLPGTFYYPDILERLIEHQRQSVPEITSESAGEVAIQMLRSFALVGHYCMVVADMLAHEGLMVTAQTRDALAAHLRLIGYDLAGDSPSVTDLLYTLTRSFNTSTAVVPAYSLAATKLSEEDDPVLFEVDEAITVSRTDQVGKAFVFDESLGVYTDRTTEANTDASTFQVLPAVPAAGDCLYVGHDTAMTNRLGISGISVSGAGITGVWEYADDNLEDAYPDVVTDLGTTLKLQIDGLLGTTDSRAGLAVTITLNSTGASETVTSTHDGSNNYATTTTHLGQTSPSTTATDYRVGAVWHEFTGVDDDTESAGVSMVSDGDVDWTLPQTTTEDWAVTEVNSEEMYWLRFRVISVSGPTAPTLDRLKWDQRDLFVLVGATQGRTRSEVLGSSTGLADQSFVLASQNVIEGTVVVSVGSVAWTETDDDFLTSTSVDRHYTVEIDADGIGTVRFGDGTNGKIPPLGVNNVTAVYRTDAHDDGNVGSGTIVVNRTGLSNIRAVTNPRPATGWAYRRGTTAEDRELLKLQGPAELRTLERAVTALDIPVIAIGFRTAAGQAPFVRAVAVEGVYGVKTVKVTVVGPAGAATTSSDRDELEEHLNGVGDDYGVLVMNQQATVIDYAPVAVDVTVTIYGGDADEAEATIRALLSPLAVDVLGDYRYTLRGGLLYRSRISAELMRLGGVTNAVVTLPAADVVLAEGEAPIPGTINVTVA